MFRKDPNSKSNRILSDTPQGTNEFNSLRKDITDDLERIDKVFDLVNALYDVLADKPNVKMNKWMTLKPEDSVTKINNAFLL